MLNKKEKELKMTNKLDEKGGEFAYILIKYSKENVLHKITA